MKINFTTYNVIIYYNTFNIKNYAKIQKLIVTARTECYSIKEKRAL